MKILPIQIRLILIAACSLFISCVDESEIQGNRPGEDEGDGYLISLQMPGNKEISTYGVDAPDENYIRMVDVLVFDTNDQFLYLVTGTNIEDNLSGTDGDKKTFKVNLLRTSGADQIRLVVLANARYHIGSIQPGEDKATILDRIVFDLPDDHIWLAKRSNNFDPIPMWGESGDVKADGTPIPPISMLRALAKVDVGLNYQGNAPAGFGVYRQTSLTNIDYMVELTDIYVYNVKTKGKVVPSPANYSAADRWVTDPSLPSGNLNHKGPIHYVPDSKLEAKRQIYLMESPGVNEGDEENALCLVVGMRYRNFSGGGYYGNGDPEPDSITYYRIDFLHTDGSNLQSQLDILRNHRYKVNIKSINGKGYPTKEEAFREMAFNNKKLLDVDIQIEDELSYSISDGKYSLSIKQDFSENNWYNTPQTLYKITNATVTTKIQLETNYPEGWTAKVMPGYENWISFVGPASGNANQPGELTIRLSATDTLRNGAILIKAGRMMAPVNLNQGETFLVPANQPSSNNKELVVNLNSLENEYSWYPYANVPYMHNSLEVSPAGVQQYPPYKNSCTAQNWQGYHNWRLPSIDEIRAIHHYFYNSTSQSSRGYFSGWVNYLFSASSSDGNETLYIRRTQTGSSWDGTKTVYQFEEKADRKDWQGYYGNYNSDRYVRCIRTIDEPFYTTTGTIKLLTGSVETQTIVVYSRMGLAWDKGAGYDDVISATNLGTPVNVEHGYKKWTIQLTTKLAADNAPLKNSMIILKTSGNEQQINVRLNQAQGPGLGYVVPKEKSDLGYDLMVHPTDQIQLVNNYTWYVYANVADYMHSPKLPPVAGQIYTDTGTGHGPDGERPNSCAALRTGGYTDWRLPTVSELEAMNIYFKPNGGLSRYGLLEAGNPYHSAVSNKVYGETTTAQNAACYNFGTYVTSTYNKGTTYLNTRCVRGNQSFYVVPESVPLKISNKAGNISGRIVVYSKEGGLSSSYTKGSNFDDIIQPGSVTMTKVHTNSDGYEIWDVSFIAKENNEMMERSTSLTLKSGNNAYSQTFRITQNMPAYSIPKSKNSLGYGMMVATEDQDYGKTWYVYANTPDNYYSFNTPPGGLQVSTDTGPDGTRPYSCAALRYGDYTDWRLPTMAELKALQVYFRGLSGSNNIESYFYSASYVTAETQTSNVYNVTTYEMGGSNEGQQSKSATSFATRCVRTDDNFYVSTANLVFGPVPESLILMVYTKNGLKPYVKGTNFDNIIAGVTQTLVGTAADGTQSWKLVLTSDDAVIGDRTTSITVTSSDNAYSKTIQISQKSIGSLLSAAQTSLGYDIVVHYQDQIRDAQTTWYVLANVPDGTNTADSPPAGAQVYNSTGAGGTRPNSCASLRTGNYADWRLPTLSELQKVFAYFDTPQNDKFYSNGFAYSSYTSSDAYISGNLLNYFIFQSFYHGGVHSYNAKNSGNLYGRCIRATKDVQIASTVNPLVFPQTATTQHIWVSTKKGLKLTQESGFSGIASVTSTKVAGPGAEGYETYDIAITSNTPTSLSDVTKTLTISAADNSSPYVLNVTLKGLVYFVPSQSMYVYYTDQPTGQTWFEYVNVANGNTSTSVPPVPQVTSGGGAPTGERTNSCAALRVGGYTDWRLPTRAEALAMFTYFAGQTGGITTFNFVADFYHTSESQSTSQGYIAYTNGVATSMTAKTGTGYRARCVRK